MLPLYIIANTKSFEPKNGLKRGTKGVIYELGRYIYIYRHMSKGLHSNNGKEHGNYCDFRGVLRLASTCSPIVRNHRQAWSTVLTHDQTPAEFWFKV